MDSRQAAVQVSFDLRRFVVANVNCLMLTARTWEALRTMNDSTLSQQFAELRRTRYAQIPRLRYVMQSFLPLKSTAEKLT